MTPKITNSIQNSFDRGLYKRIRKETGCPPVIAGKTGFSRAPYWAEVKDGSLLLEQINAQSLFEAKYICVKEWAKRHRLPGHEQ